MENAAGRRRVVVESVTPEIDGGRFPIKRTSGETVVVEADVFADGHDVLAALLSYRHEQEPLWTEVPMEFSGNDRWRASFSTTKLGRYRYTVTGWVDHFATWRNNVMKKVNAGQHVPIELLVGADLIQKASGRAAGADATRLQRWATELRSSDRKESDRVRLALSTEVEQLVARYPDRSTATTYERELDVIVDRVKARFSSWYEMFPRSCSGLPGRHGTFKDCEALLPYVASMGFDVLYLPPLHPIGRTNRKGKNNAPTAGPGDPGSPWAIGSEDGG